VRPPVVDAVPGAAAVADEHLLGVRRVPHEEQQDLVAPRGFRRAAAGLVRPAAGRCREDRPHDRPCVLIGQSAAVEQPAALLVSERVPAEGDRLDGSHRGESVPARRARAGSRGGGVAGRAAVVRAPGGGPGRVEDARAQGGVVGEHRQGQAADVPALRHPPAGVRRRSGLAARVEPQVRAPLDRRGDGAGDPGAAGSPVASPPAPVVANTTRSTAAAVTTRCLVVPVLIRHLRRKRRNDTGNALHAPRAGEVAYAASRHRVAGGEM
jgi:hypothetical protein